MHLLAKCIPRVVAAAAFGVACLHGVGAAELTGTHADWKTYRHVHRGETLCFAVAKAAEHKPSGGDREAPYVYVTAWPRAGIKTEFSLLLGYPLDKGAEVTADISGNTFTLTADGDRAYISSPPDEQKILDAMRRGKTMTVEGTSDTGSRSRDVFSLAGATASIQAIVAGCN